MMTGLESFAAELAVEAAKSLAGIVLKGSWQGMGKLGKMLDIKTQQLVVQASEKYVKKYSERHGMLKVLGMREPVTLESLYTSVQLLHKWDMGRFESIENLEKAYRESRSFQPQNSIKQDGLKVANETQYLTVNLTRTPARPGTPTRAFTRALTLAVAQQLESIKIFKEVNFTLLIARLEALKVKAPSINQSYKAHQGFNYRVSQTWLNALNLNPELVSLSTEELQSLENYLYANLLIVKCKQAAVRVSPKTWEKIEGEMLRS